MNIYLLIFALLIVLTLFKGLCFFTMSSLRHSKKHTTNYEEVLKTMDPIAYNKLQIKKHRKKVAELQKNNKF